MIQVPEDTRIIGIIAPSFTRGTYYKTRFNLVDIPGNVRYRIITPAVNLAGIGLHGIFDPFGIMLDPQYREWVETELYSRIRIS